MRHYEIIYIVNPNLNDEEYHELLKKFNDIIQNKGVIIKIQEWGKQRLAYRIKKFYNGVYVLVEFCANAEITSELERSLNLDDRILKFQTVKLADQANPDELLEKEKAAQEKANEQQGGVEEPNPDSDEDEEQDEEDDDEVDNGN